MSQGRGRSWSEVDITWILWGCQVGPENQKGIKKIPFSCLVLVSAILCFHECTPSNCSISQRDVLAANMSMQQRPAARAPGMMTTEGPDGLGGRVGDDPEMEDMPGRAARFAMAFQSATRQARALQALTRQGQRNEGDQQQQQQGGEEQEEDDGDDAEEGGEGANVPCPIM